MLRLSCYGFLLVLGFMLASNLWIVSTTWHRVFTRPERLVSSYSVALVLGTSPMRADGVDNPFFVNRMKAVVELYKMGGLRYVIVSGDNRTQYYNEPIEMKNQLIRLGIPVDMITLDYAGLRTLDSVVRCKEVFGQDRLVIVTQAFHAYRALFIARYYDMDACAWGAEEPAEFEGLWGPYWREYFARAKAVIDLYVLKTMPMYLGKRESLNGV